MGYRWLVAVILVVHFGYLAYLILGGFLAWRWPKAFWPHLLAAVWAVLIVLAWVNCPLTAAENWARAKQGQVVPTAGFIDRYLTNVIYPAKYINLVRLAVALVVLVAWVGAYVRWRSSRRAGRTPAAQTSDSVASN